MHVDLQVNFIWWSLRSILYYKWGQKDRFDGYELVPEWPPPYFKMIRLSLNVVIDVNLNQKSFWVRITLDLFLNK